MVKIDVEGWENEVLKGMEQTLKFKPILIVENGPLFSLGYFYLLDLGYKAYRFTINKNFVSPLIEVDDIYNAPIYDNIIFIPK